MNVARQDAWSEDEDILLAEVVLRQIREGGTQLAAFEEVGKQLSRTAAACGFRWNSTVRKQFKSAIAIAKEQRKSSRTNSYSQTEKTLQAEEKSELMDLQKIITSLQSIQKRLQDGEGNRHIEISVLKSKLAEAQRERNDFKCRFEKLNEDYEVLLSIMEKARKMTVNTSGDNSEVHLKMDANGNLERVKK